MSAAELDSHALRMVHAELVSRIAGAGGGQPVIVMITGEGLDRVRADRDCCQMLAGITALGRAENIIVRVGGEP